MDANFDMIVKTLKTLPIGYYIKRDGVSVEYYEGDKTSHYSPLYDTVYINVTQILDEVKEHGTSENYETIVRSMFYHEVSHAFLTPEKLSVTDILNIFEDERIESILRDYYLDVDFRAQVYMLNGSPRTPLTPIEAFFNLVRYRVGNPELLKEVHDIIVKYKKLNRKSDYYECFGVYDYVNDVEELYEKVFREFESSKSYDSESSERDDEEGDSESGKSSKSPESTPEELDGEDEDEELDEESIGKSSLDESDERYDIETTQKLVESYSTCSFRDEEIIQRMKSLLQNKTNKVQRNSSAINSYSGVFDPRSVIREDYKYFVQKNRYGHASITSSKVHFNLFIDVSGSFWRSEKIVNSLLFSLEELEKEDKDFEFDLITMQMGEKLIDKKKRRIRCGGGNRLDSEIFKIFKDQQKSNCTNYNLVLFDGDAYSDGGDKTAFKAFNTSNTVVISDDDNKWCTDRYCKDARVKITKDYSEELIDEVFKNLERIWR